MRGGTLASVGDSRILTAAMTSMQFTNDFARGDIQRRKQRGRFVAHIVVRASLENPVASGSIG